MPINSADFTVLLCWLHELKRLKKKLRDVPMVRYGLLLFV